MIEIDFDLKMPPRGERVDVELFLDTPWHTNYELLVLLYEGLEKYRLGNEFDITPNFLIQTSQVETPDCLNHSNKYCTND